ncbi:MAG: PAS domain S-box protein, partial [Desulfarculus sp.]|nr:PAS domain S-box protein [Desulfarculus sp.]
MSDLKIKSRVDELEQRYKLIAENLVDAIWVLDLETMRYDFITPSVTRLSGYTPEEYEQFRVLDRLRPDSAAVLLAALAEEKSLFDKGLSQRRTFEVEMIHKDGHPYWVEISSKLYRDEGGRIKIAGVSKDISRRKAAEKEREDLIQRLGLALAEKERLLKEVKVLRGLLPIC